MSKLPPGPLPINVTTYCPFKPNSGSGAGIEGGVNDRKSHPLHTFEMHRDNPEVYPYVSLAGDYNLFAYGQLMSLPFLGAPSEDWVQRTGKSEYQCRVVDTGGNFFGPNKVYRHPGWEPIDVCVDDCSNHPFSTGQQNAEIVDEGVVRDVLGAIGVTSGGDIIRNPGDNMMVILVGGLLLGLLLL